MQQEVAIRVNDLIAQGWWNGECATVDYSAGGSSLDGRDMANCAANLIEELRSSLRISSGCQQSVARRSFSRSHKVSQGINALFPGGLVRTVLRISYGVALGHYFSRENTIRYSQIGKVRCCSEG